MKGLDSPALLALLEGDPSIKRVLRAWSGEEIATTELNLLELTVIAQLGPAASRASRLEAINRLRRRLTVLPVDSRSQTAFAARAAPPQSASELLMASVFSTLEGGGCNEILTGPKSRTPQGRWKLKVRRISIHDTE